MDGFVIERMGDENVVRLSDEEMRERGLNVGNRVAVESLDADHDEAMRIARDLMDRYKNALAELAK